MHIFHDIHSSLKNFPNHHFFNFLKSENPSKAWEIVEIQSSLFTSKLKNRKEKVVFSRIFFKLLFFPVMIIYIVLCIPINLSSFCLSGLKFFRQILVLFWIYFNLTIFLVKSIQSGLEYLINPDRKT